MTRLTDWIRNGIKKRAVTKAFEGERNALVDRESTLARLAYVSLFPEDERAKADDLPKRWLYTSSEVDLNVGGKRVKLKLVDAVVRLPFDLYHSKASVLKHSGLIEQVERLLADKEKLAEKEKIAETQLDALLASVTTIKRLRETWPEGEQFYAHVEAEPRNLPAVRVDDLNRTLNLTK